MSEEQKNPQTLADTLRPYEEFILRMQEVLLFKRPLVLVLLLVGILSFYLFVRSSEAGFFAVIALFFVVLYGIAIIWTYLKKYISKYLFKPLPADDPLAPNRVRTLEEFCEFIEKASKRIAGSEKQTKASSLRRIITSVVAFFFAFLFTKVDPFYFNLIFTFIIILLPGTLLHPMIYKLIFRNKIESRDVKPIEERKEEPLPQIVSDPVEITEREVKIKETEKKENTSSSSSSSSDHDHENNN
ncbi:hypothetical protein GPJ56_002590 [Histomonas meleagridis]|uniref:uncharacterized protein n=1 Tax=Histomonas meleagridis TaxID=135588 RepID=UPI0035599947|nr:hypothetical protein GPJ56_002590 [Histomonas meleagridis]KAH0801382.1 hypothetical protein GO595_005977 [Histomonas meleagridis]